MTNVQLTPDAVADRAEVDRAFVERAVASGAMGQRVQHGFTSEDATRLRFLKAWDDAGLPVDTVGALVEQGEITFSFLDVPGLGAQPREVATYEQLAAEYGIDVALVETLYEALGFTPPAPSEPVRADDLVLARWLRQFTGAGITTASLVRLARVYSSSLHRMARAEAEIYEAEIEDRLRATGASEQDLLTTGGELGNRLMELFEHTILSLYRRHRQHVWLDHSVTHVELILESHGLFERLDRPPCVAFVDLTGYTRLTEERGDAAAAELAGRLAALVEAITRRHDGRAVKWMGDGGLLVFHDPAPAVHAALEMTTQTAASDLPPTHIGIHCGPVVFQDGDIYGRTVNIAARLSGQARAGEVLLSQQVANRLDSNGLTLQHAGMLKLRGVTKPLPAYRVRR